METPLLQRRDEFETVLANYAMNDSARVALVQTKLVLLVAASGTGKNAIITELLKTGNYYSIVTDTTRPPRVNNGVLERDGVEYFFRSEDDMLQDLQQGHFVEAALIHDRQVSGVSVREIKKAQQQHKIAITDVDVAGADSIIALKPDARAVFILPPSFEVWLNRLQGRSPDMTANELNRRLATACKEFSLALKREYYQFVINDDLQTAVQQVDKFANAASGNAASQVSARQLVTTLLSKAEEFLKQRLL